MAFRNAPKAIHGWKDGEKFYLSLNPRGDAKNEYASAREAVSEASKRKLSIVWENPEEVK